MKVAILGCGPAGLMAAHAVSRVHQDMIGRRPDITIYSNRRKSTMYGSQYLHRPIPGVTPTAFALVDYRMQGSPDAYRRKVYGQTWDGEVSPQDYEGMQQAWDIRATYDRLWILYNKLVEEVIIDPAGVKALMSHGYDLIVNSIPLSSLCFQGHEFRSQPIIAAGDALDIGIDIGSQFHCPDNTVICNGDDQPTWYRMSRIFGYTTVEWPMWKADARVPIRSAARVEKPLGHNCDCWPGILNVGRYGSWTKGVLSDSAYTTTYAELSALAVSVS